MKMIKKHQKTGSNVLHKQKFVKVNVPVDEKICEVVEAFNEFNGLQTLESCQGNNGIGFILFIYGNVCLDPCRDKESDLLELLKFALIFLGTRLVDQFGDAVDLRVRVNTFKKLRCEFFFNKKIYCELVKFLKQLAKVHNQCAP